MRSILRTPLLLAIAAFAAPAHGAAPYRGRAVQAVIDELSRSVVAIERGQRQGSGVLFAGKRQVVTSLSVVAWTAVEARK